MPPTPLRSARSRPAAARLLEVTERSLWAGIDQLRDGNRLHDVGQGGAEGGRGRGLLGRAQVRRARHRHRDARGPTSAQLLARDARPEDQGRQRLRDRADGEHRDPRHDRARRRLERRDRGREPFCALRAHRSPSPRTGRRCLRRPERLSWSRLGSSGRRLCFCAPRAGGQYAASIEDPSQRSC